MLAALLVHLAEVETRGVHRTRRCASLYTYCVYELADDSVRNSGDNDNHAAAVGANEEALPVGPVPADLPPVTKPQHYQVQFTSSEEHAQLIDRAKALLARERPTITLGELHLDAMKLLVASLEKRQFAVGAIPRTSPSAVSLQPNTPTVDEPPRQSVTDKPTHPAITHEPPRQSVTSEPPRQSVIGEPPRQSVDGKPNRHRTETEPSPPAAGMLPPRSGARCTGETAVVVDMSMCAASGVTRHATSRSIT